MRQSESSLAIDSGDGNYLIASVVQNHLSQKVTQI